MSSKVPKEEQPPYVCEYYRSFIQSAMEPILFDEINGVDWQVLIGTFIQDQLHDMHDKDEEDIIQYIFERKPSQRVIDLLRRTEAANQEERRTGMDRRGGDRRNDET
jgi:hypothetical protein